MSIQSTGLSAPANKSSLATAGILVNIKMTTTTLSISNKAVSDEICGIKKADTDAGNFIQKLIGKNEHHQAVMSYRATLDACGAARSLHAAASFGGDLAREFKAARAQRTSAKEQHR